jgi:hypothetical protein
MEMTADIEGRIVEDFQEFIEENSDNLNKLDENGRLMVAFISGAQTGAKYMAELESEIFATSEEEKDAEQDT